MSIESSTTTATTYGYLVLTVTPAAYVTYAVNDFPDPVNLGVNPTYAAKASSNNIREGNRRYLIYWMHYNTYHTADKAFHKQLIDAIPAIYLENIKHNTLRFGKCTSLNILDHLLDNGIINDDQLAVNLENIKVLW